MNLPTVLILVLVLAAVALALWSLRRSSRRGGCNCGCGDCAMKGQCGSAKKSDAE